MNSEKAGALQSAPAYLVARRRRRGYILTLALREQLRRELLARRWTRADLARRSGISCPTAGRAVDGGAISAETVGLIAAALLAHPALPELAGWTGADSEVWRRLYRG